MKRRVKKGCNSTEQKARVKDREERMNEKEMEVG